MNKRLLLAWMPVLFFAGCDSGTPPTQAPAPKTSNEQYNGVYSDQVNALNKAKAVGAEEEQSNAEQQKKLDSATQ